MPPEFSYASLDEVVRYFVSKQAEAVTDATEVIYDSSAVGRDWADVPDSTALEVYRIVQEATGNAMKHSGSDRIAVSLTLTEDRLEATVADNGTRRAGTPTARRGIGLDSMRRRASAIGGKVSVEPVRPTGTMVRLTVDL